jgi:hypothetical protein
MAVTNFSPLLGLALPTTGDLSGTWGTTVNDSITGLIDSAVAGTATLSTDANVTLTTTNGSANQARQAILLCTGARTTLKTITAPAQSKAYVVINATTGGFGVKVVGAGPTTGVTIANGEKALIAWNGSDFVVVAVSVIDLTAGVKGILPVVNGGTGVATSTGTVNVVLSNSPTLVTPALGTPSSAVLTNATGLPISTGVAGLGTGVATFLATPSSANLAAAVTDETGSGALVFGTSPTLTTPTFVTPTLGTPASGTLTNATGLPLTTGVTGILPIANGGTATATPSLVQGTGITITGSWPNQTITNTGSTTATQLVTTNFSISEIGGVLVFKYGATTIATMTGAGVFTTLSDITGNGTP